MYQRLPDFKLKEINAGTQIELSCQRQKKGEEDRDQKCSDKARKKHGRMSQHYNKGETDGMTSCLR